MSSNIIIASRALARLGEPPISSFEDDSDTAEKVAQLYEQTILGLLARHSWHFAKAKKVLSEDGAAEPVNEWARGFLMPPLDTDRVSGPTQVFNTTSRGALPFFDYEVQDRWIMTDATVVVMEYVKRKPESDWPGYFRNLAVEALAAALALPVTENQSKEIYHRQVAFGSPSENSEGGLFKVAITDDQKSQPTRSLIDDVDLMQSVRFGGYR